MVVNSVDDVLAGSLLILICIICIAWYIIVQIGVFRVARTSPTFIIFFSQGIGDMGFVLNNLWLGVDIIVGRSILIQDSKIYSIAINIFNRPVLYHYALIAATRLFAVRFPYAFCLFFTRKNSIRICVGTWFCSALEVFVIHVYFPVEAYLNHNIEKYGFASKNITYYLSTPLPAYFNTLNITIGVGTFMMYAMCISILRKKSARSSNEGRILVFCLINNLTIFIPTLMRAIMKTSTKWQLLTVQIVWMLSFEFSAVTLPICSSELRYAMFPKWKEHIHKLSQRISIISDSVVLPLPTSFPRSTNAFTYRANCKSNIPTRAMAGAIAAMVPGRRQSRQKEVVEGANRWENGGEAENGKDAGCK